MPNNEENKGMFRNFLGGFKRLIKGEEDESSTSAVHNNEGSNPQVNVNPEDRENFLIEKALESIQYYDRLDVMNIGGEEDPDESQAVESEAGLEQEKMAAKSQAASTTESTETSISSDSMKKRGLKSTADSISLSLSIESKKASRSLEVTESQTQSLEVGQSDSKEIYLYREQDQDNFIGLVGVETFQSPGNESEHPESVVIDRIALLPSFRNESVGYQIFCELKERYPNTAFLGSRLTSELLVKWSSRYAQEHQES